MQHSPFNGGEGRLERLRVAAEEVVAEVLAALPPDLRERAVTIPVTYEARPNEAMLKSGISRHTLGLFLGERFDDGMFRHAPLPSQIILFLESIWDMASHSTPHYREEVRRVFLHELGHYLGLNEREVRKRAL